jgi:hypothetical protein
MLKPSSVAVPYPCERTQALLPQTFRQRIAFVGTGQRLGPRVCTPLRFLMRGGLLFHLRRLRVPERVHVIISAAARVSVIAHRYLLGARRNRRRLVPTANARLRRYEKRGSDDRHTCEHGKSNEPPSMAESRSPLPRRAGRRMDLVSSR